MKKISNVKQDCESYDELVLLFEGEAKQLTPEFPGDIRFLFVLPSGEKQCVVFDWVSSVVYGHELLYSYSSYPYFQDTKGNFGLYRIEGSSYMERIGQYFPKHHHYIYFDREFNWHITARGIEVSEI